MTNKNILQDICCEMRNWRRDHGGGEILNWNGIIALEYQAS